MAELEKKTKQALVPSEWEYAPAPESREIVQLDERYGHFVGGEWLEPRETYTTISPASEEPLAEAGQATPEEVHDAICQATRVFGDYKRRDWTYETPIAPVRFWTEAASPEDVGNGEARSFLRAFGQANREQFDRQPGGSILQAMTLMNSPFVTRRVMAANGSLVEQLVKSTKGGAEIVDELYLGTLSRYPLPQEKQLAVSWIEKDRKQGAEDLHWSLLNKLDFVFNY